MEVSLQTVQEGQETVKWSGLCFSQGKVCVSKAPRHVVEMEGWRPLYYFLQSSQRLKVAFLPPG